MGKLTKVSAILVAAASTFFASAGAAEPAIVERLAAALDGRFDTRCTCSSGTASAGERFVDWRQRINAPSLGDVVFYQQQRRGDGLELHRQRILVLAWNDLAGRIEQTSFGLRDGQRFVDARADAPAFAALGPQDLEPAAVGCEEIWSETSSGFISYVDPAACRIASKDTGEHRRIEVRTSLDGQGLSLVERVFDDAGNQLSGPPPGESVSLWR